MSFNAVLQSSTTVTGTGSTNAGTGATLPANTRGALICINVSAASGTNPVAVFSLDWYDPGQGAWVSLEKTSNITGASNNLYVVYPDASEAFYNVLPSNFRISWALTGTNPSFTFTIGLNYLN